MNTYVSADNPLNPCNTPPNTHLMLAKDARIKQQELNSPDKIKAENDIIINQELNRINEYIQDALMRNESSLLVCIYREPKILDQIKESLTKLGYTVTAEDTSNNDSLYQFTIKW